MIESSDDSRKPKQKTNKILRVIEHSSTCQLQFPLSICRPPEHPLLSCWPRQTQLLAHLSNVCFGKWNLIYFHFLERNLIKRKSENNSRKLCHLSSWMEAECWEAWKSPQRKVYFKFFFILNFFPHFHVIKTQKGNRNEQENLCQSSPSRCQCDATN